jgi:hypothetical protein
MAFLPRPVSPTSAIADMVAFIRERRKHQYVFAALAVAIPILMFYAFQNEFNRSPQWKQPVITYVEQWRPDRTLKDIVAQQAKDLPGELARKKAEAEAEAAHKAELIRLKERLRAVGI